MCAIRFKYRVPANQDDFELLGLAILRAHWSCSSLELYARRGEKQFGVDIFDPGANDPISAGQCKLHEEWKSISPAEIKAEVVKAKKFRPQLRRYAVLTTAKASRKAHDAMLQLNADHQQQGIFQVELITWGKIEALLDKYDAIRDEFYLTISGTATREIKEKLSAIHNAVLLKAQPFAVVTQNEPAAALPKADRNRFAVALAHLTHDEGQKSEHLIGEAIRDLPGVQVLRFDRTLSAEGPVPESSERQAHDDARKLLRESGADVLIWGTIVSHDGRTAPRLYWTTGSSGTHSRRPYVPENFQLPDLFWEDLVQVLSLLVATQSAELFARRGQSIAAELMPFVNRVRDLIKTADPSRAWSSAAIAQVMLVLALGLQKLGEELGRRELFIESIAFYRKLLDQWDKKGMPEYWVAARNGLGVALGGLGSIESGNNHLLEAERIFRDLVGSPVSRKRTPAFLAAIHSNLGSTLLQLGLRQSSTAELVEATGSYRVSLRLWTRNEFPLDWASAQNNLGYVLQETAARTGNLKLMSAAIDAHRSALNEYPRDLVPLYWATAQNNLGNALRRLGEHQSGIELVEEAVACFRAALEERAFEHQPLAWGEAQNNLGAALLEIADRIGDQTGLRDAVVALRESLKVRTREVAPPLFASSKNNLGYALTRLGEFEGDVAHLREAVESLQDALQVWTREEMPARWSTAKQNLGNALTSLGRKERAQTFLEQARAAYEDALLERDREQQPLLWAGSQAALGHVYVLQGEWEVGTESLEIACNYYEEALQEYRKELVPFQRAGVEYNLGNALRLLGERSKSARSICDAVTHHAAACKESLSYSPYWAFRAAEAVEADIASLKLLEDPATYEQCVAAHSFVLALRVKHANHRLSLMPIFRAIVPGKSGTIKPDFGSAWRKGDRLKDGTVVWENGGKYSYCMDCDEFLVPGEVASSAKAPQN